MPKIDQKSARSTHADAERAADELCAQLGPGAPKLLVFFACRSLDHVALNAALRARLPTTRLVGGSSPGEIDSDGFHVGTVVASAMWGDFEVGIGLGQQLTSDPVAAGGHAVRMACEQLGVEPAQLGRRHVGLVLDDGLRHKKESFLIGMLEPNPSLVLVGGGASDPEYFSPTAKGTVHVDGDVTEDAVVLVLFETDVPWAAMRSHWYEPTGQTITITKVDGSCMQAIEIDGQPAAQRYAELIGVGIDELEFGKPKGFATLPTALRVGREHFMRVPWMPMPDGSILFANMVEEGMELELMKLGNMAESTRRFFSHEIPKRVGEPSAIFAFHCIGRSNFARSTGALDELAEAFRGVQHLIGLDAYFELYCSFSINTTCTALAFGTT